MTKRPDQHNIDPEEAGTTDHKFHRDQDDPAPDPEPDEQDTPPPPPTPQEMMEKARRQAEADRKDELERARENIEDR